MEWRPQITPEGAWSAQDTGIRGRGCLRCLGQACEHAERSERVLLTTLKHSSRFREASRFIQRQNLLASPNLLGNRVFFECPLKASRLQTSTVFGCALKTTCQSGACVGGVCTRTSLIRLKRRPLTIDSTPSTPDSGSIFRRGLCGRRLFAPCLASLEEPPPVIEAFPDLQFHAIS